MESCLIVDAATFCRCWCTKFPDSPAVWGAQAALCASLCEKGFQKPPSKKALFHFGSFKVDVVWYWRVLLLNSNQSVAMPAWLKLYSETSFLLLLSYRLLSSGHSATENEERRHHRLGLWLAFVQTQQKSQQLSRIIGFIAINCTWELHATKPALCSLIEKCLCKPCRREVHATFEISIAYVTI